MLFIPAVDITICVHRDGLIFSQENAPLPGRLAVKLATMQTTILLCNCEAKIEKG